MDDKLKNLILQLSRQKGMEAEDIAEELDIPKQVVNKVLSKRKVKDHEK